jgi:6-phosphogluconolactonase
MSLKRNSTAGELLVFETAEQLAVAAAERFVAHAQEAIVDHGLFSVSLAGGKTPKRMYEVLGTKSFRSRIDWSRIHIFFGDERCVPPDHPESNYRLADDRIISRVKIPPQNVHPINGDGDPIRNAQLYEDELRSFFPGRQWPRLDLVLLGMGEDGHTASLFPGTPALKEQRAWVFANWIDKLKAYRITLTVPAINGAANMMFLVVGVAKAATLARVLNETRDPDPVRDRLPAQLIKPESGSLNWLVDAQAASKLRPVSTES